MQKSKVFFTDFRTKAHGDGLPTKLRKLILKAGLADIDMDGKFVAIKMHFGELGNISYLRPNYARAVVEAVNRLFADEVSVTFDPGVPTGTIYIVPDEPQYTYHIPHRAEADPPSTTNALVEFEIEKVVLPGPCILIGSDTFSASFLVGTLVHEVCHVPLFLAILNTLSA